MSVRAAIIGGGFMGTVHARAIRASGARLLGVASSSPDSAQKAAETFGAEGFYRDVAELLADERVEVVHVCVPNRLHYDIAEAALAAGRHVVCEKPLATSVARARRLASLAATGRLIGAVPFVYRYYPMVREARARVAAGELGRVFLAHGGYLQDWLLGAEETNWRVDAAAGGPSRAFADIGSHWVDLVEFLTGDTIVTVSAQTEIVHEARPSWAGSGPSFSSAAGRDTGLAQPVETEDLAVVSLRTAAGAIGSTVVSQVSAGHRNHLWIEVDGTEQSLGFDQERPDHLAVGRQEGRTLLERDPALLSAAAAPYARLPAGHPQGYQDCFNAFVDDTYRAVRGETPDGLPTFSAGVRAAAITEAVLRSAGDGGAWTDVEPEAATAAAQAVGRT